MSVDRDMLYTLMCCVSYHERPDVGSVYRVGHAVRSVGARSAAFVGG